MGAERENEPLLPEVDRKGSLVHFLREHCGADAAEATRLDVAKLMLMFLVVAGHMIEPFYKVGSRVAWCMEVWIYSFHMPAFILLSGYVSGDNDSRRRRQMVTSFVLPYLVLQFAFCNWYVQVYYLHNDHHPSGIFTRNWQLWTPYPDEPERAPTSVIGGWTFLQPFSHLWYLITLLFHRVYRPCALEFKCSFLIHILAGCLVGYTQIGRWLSVHRTVAFMPYFLAGFLMKEHNCFFPSAKGPKQAACALAALAFTVAASCFLALVAGVKFEVFLLADPYDTTYGTEYMAYGSLFTAAQYIWSFAAMASFFAVIPDAKAMGIKAPPLAVHGDAEVAGAVDGGIPTRRSSVWRERDQFSLASRVYVRFAKYGARTLYPYVLHFAVFMALEMCGLYDFTWEADVNANSWSKLMLLAGTTALAFLMTIALSVRTGAPLFFRWLLQPEVSFVFTESS